MSSFLSIHSARNALHASGRCGLLVPCLFAVGCSLQVTGKGSGAVPIEAGAEAVGAVGTDAGADTQEPSGDAQVSMQTPDAALVFDAGREPDSSLVSERDSAPDDEPDARVPDVEDASMADASCTLDGSFALRFAFDVSWVGTEFLDIVPVIEAGQGELSFVVSMNLQSSATGYDASFSACSASVPEFVAALSRERYQVRVKDEVWDNDAMPVFSTSLETSCLEPGCSIGGEPIYALIGALLRPPSAPWPTQASMGEWPDQDGDGQPGITGQMSGPSDGPYQYPPLDLLSSRRMRELWLGLRVTVAFDGTLDSCDAFSGQTTQGNIQTRAVGCQATSAPLPCTSEDLNFLNDNLPVWTAHQGRFEAKRLPAKGDCKAARRAFMPKVP